MSVPTRVQRHRTKGWKKPAGAVYVGRGSKWGNAISWKDLLEDGHDPRMARQVATEAFEDNLAMRDWDYPSEEEVRAELAGKDLMCWCPLTQPCHADVLLELANGDRLPVGTLVQYWPGARTGPGRLSITRTPIWKVGSGTEVVSVEGYAGGIALSHIEPFALDLKGVALVEAIIARKAAGSLLLEGGQHAAAEPGADEQQTDGQANPYRSLGRAALAEDQRSEHTRDEQQDEADTHESGSGPAGLGSGVPHVGHGAESTGQQETDLRPYLRVIDEAVASMRKRIEEDEEA